MHVGVEGAAPQSSLPTNEKGDEESTSVCDGGGPMALQVKVDIQQSIAGDMSPEPKNREQAMNLSDGEKWRKAEEVEMHGLVENSVYKQVTRLKGGLVIGTKILYNRKVYRTERWRSISVDLSRKGSGKSKGRTTRKSTHPPQRPRQSGCFCQRQKLRVEIYAILMRSRNS